MKQLSLEITTLTEVPIIPKYHKLLFEDAEGSYQISIDDTEGKNTSANAIKKAFISNAKRNNINNVMIHF